MSENSKYSAKLFEDITSLKGIGEKLAQLLGNYGILKVKDFLFFTPRTIIDRTFTPQGKDLTEEDEGRYITIKAEAKSYNIPPKFVSRPSNIACVMQDGTPLKITFFNVYGTFLEDLLPKGQTRAISGKLSFYNKKPQLINPDLVRPEYEFDKVQSIEPVYTKIYGISSKKIENYIKGSVISLVPDYLEWHSEDFLKSKNYPTFYECLHALHNPKDLETLEPESIYIQRLAFDELVNYQLKIVKHKVKRKREKGIAIKGDDSLIDMLTNSLPFTLTNGQQGILNELYNDIASNTRMNRLLQGDVGAGKTVVALLTMLKAAEGGYQSALMAPTEILARQHAKWIKEICITAGIELGIDVITGSTPSLEKDIIYRKLATGEIDLIIGTHALFQDRVIFNNLALIIVDEQHRFGVNQRLALSEKGEGVNVLMMSATPIPRTLAMTIYGDMDVSSLTEKPAGRKEIKTVALPKGKAGEVAARLDNLVKKGEKAFWICPFIDEAETDDEFFKDVTPAEERFKELKKVYKNRVAMVHGRMKEAERDKIMREFRDGGFDILVATTVIEVGIDIKKATTIIIENAERFGLAQLHQLRGRVGRNDKDCSCILLYGKYLSETGQKRLNVLRETNDGFRIAEEDLDLRGAGDYVGTKQSGVPAFRIAKLHAHKDLLEEALSYAKYMLEGQPDKLQSDEWQMMQKLFD